MGIINPEELKIYTEINHLFGKNRTVRVTDDISVRIPSLGEIVGYYDDPEDCWGEHLYYKVVTAFTAMPRDYIVQLYDMGLDSNEVDPFELFTMLFISMQSEPVEDGTKAATSKEILRSIFFSQYEDINFAPARDTHTSEVVLYDENNQIIINKLIYEQIGEVMCKLHFIKKNNKRPHNETIKRVLIEVEREKMKLASFRPPPPSFLDGLVVSLVNTPEFKYDYSTCKQLNIYELMSSVHQISKKINYNHVMAGVYAGTIDGKKLKMSEINWI